MCLADTNNKNLIPNYRNDVGWTWNILLYKPISVSLTFFFTLRLYYFVHTRLTCRYTKIRKLIIVTTWFTVYSKNLWLLFQEAPFLVSKTAVSWRWFLRFLNQQPSLLETNSVAHFCYRLCSVKNFPLSCEDYYWMKSIRTYH